MHGVSTFSRQMWGRFSSTSQDNSQATTQFSKDPVEVDKETFNEVKEKRRY
jgi:hypothetical protein